MPEKILTIDNSTFFVTCRIGEEPQDVQDMQWFLVGDSQNLLADQTCQSVILECHLDCKTGGRKMACCRYILNGIQYEKCCVPVWRPGNTAEPEFLRPAGCMRHIWKCERCVHKKGVKNNAEK